MNDQLNLEKGTVRVELGHRMLNRIVDVKSENLIVVETTGNIASVRKLRDEGFSVSSLVARGYSIASIQLDNSSKLCQEFCRPRYMCSCTYSLKDP